MVVKWPNSKVLFFLIGQSLERFSADSECFLAQYASQPAAWSQAQLQPVFAKRQIKPKCFCYGNQNDFLDVQMLAYVASLLLGCLFLKEFRFRNYFGILQECFKNPDFVGHW